MLKLTCKLALLSLALPILFVLAVMRSGRIGNAVYDLIAWVEA